MGKVNIPTMPRFEFDVFIGLLLHYFYRHSC